MMKKINFKHHDDALKKQFKTLHSYDLSTLFPNLDEDEKKRFVYLVESEKLKDMFIELEAEDQLELLNYLDVTGKKQLLRNLESDDLKEFISSLEDENKGEIMIKDIEVGDYILTHKGFNKVLATYKQKQPVYKIKLKNGKEITLSSNHQFPTINGQLKSIEDGLEVGEKLFTKKTE
jgi:intein/homing endonuclease